MAAHSLSSCHLNLLESKSSALEEQRSRGSCCIDTVSKLRKRRGERGDEGGIWKELNEGGKRDNDFTKSDSGENIVFWKAEFQKLNNTKSKR